MPSSNAEPQLCPYCDQPLQEDEECPCGIVPDELPWHRVDLRLLLLWVAEVAIFFRIAQAWTGPAERALGLLLLGLTMMLTQTFCRLSRQRPDKNAPLDVNI